ncbi:MAG TPA: diguanylate cyclase [Polyangiaceae bacterium]|nr:diguanylate cyclase [Polyangiaceae bacterium]
MPASAPQVELQVIGILADPTAAAVLERVLARAGTPDRFTVTTDLADGLSTAVAAAADLVFIDVTIGKGAGVAGVHHLRALMPGTTLIALATGTSVQLGTQAISLGANGLMLLPLCGDEILNAVAEVRSREAARRRVEELEARAQHLDRGVELLAQAGALTQARSRREAAARLCDLVAQHTGAGAVCVYLPATEAARQLKQVARSGPLLSLPPFCDEMDLLGAASARKLSVLKLEVGLEAAGYLVMMTPPESGGAEPFPLAEQIATQAATALSLVSAREQSHRGAMKDPATSAYTFAYFVDVAGREIDKARRHGRRFALATIAVEPPDGAASEPNGDTRAVEVVERVLGSVRATDVLARVDDLELYLLLPETGGIGGHVCRRRVLKNLAPSGGVAGAPALDVSVGVATYPQHGTDLSRLLRVAKHRADASRTSVVRALQLWSLPLTEVLDAVLWDLATPDHEDPRPEHPQTTDLPTTEVLALAAAAVGEARRGGGARVVATLRAGVGIGATVRAALGRELGDVQLDLVDVADVAGCRDLEALAVIAEHSCYALLGRNERGRVRAIHAADPLLVDLLIQRLGELARARLGG